MPNKIFFSWQSDLDSKHNTNFIRNAIKSAIDEVCKDGVNKFVYDEATRNQIGSVDVTETLFMKIKTSTVLIADITTINKNDPHHRKVPNPNVSLELGFASAILGWNNIIPIFNLAYGDLQNVPFDIRNRRIMTYHLDESSDIKKKAGELKSNIKSALKEMDIDRVRKRESITRIYANENERIKFYALHSDDDYWNADLFSELLSNVLFNLKSEYDIVNSGIIFDEKQNMNANDFWAYIQQDILFQQSLLESLSQLIPDKAVDTVNDENPIEILRLSQTIERIGLKLIQSELKKNSILVDSRLSVFIPQIGVNIDAFLKLIERVREIFDAFSKPGAKKPPINQEDLSPIFKFNQLHITEIFEIMKQIIIEEA